MQHFTPRSSRPSNRDRYVFYPRAAGRMAKVEISHRDGGWNYFSGATEKRGIEISVSLIDRSEDGRIETSSPMSEGNLRMLLEETPRYNAKKVAAWAARLDPSIVDFAARWEVNPLQGGALFQELVALPLAA